jgi:hypothetical protein
MIHFCSHASLLCRIYRDFFSDGLEICKKTTLNTKIMANGHKYSPLFVVCFIYASELNTIVRREIPMYKAK